MAAASKAARTWNCEELPPDRHRLLELRRRALHRQHGGPRPIVRPDGNALRCQSGSGIGGFEYQVNPKTLFYGYYSGAYFGKNLTRLRPASMHVDRALAPLHLLRLRFRSGHRSPELRSTGTCAQSSSTPQAAPTGYVRADVRHHQTIWRNPDYGDLRLMTQYLYVSRDTVVCDGAGARVSCRPPTTSWCTSTCATTCHRAGRTHINRNKKLQGSRRIFGAALEFLVGQASACRVFVLRARREKRQAEACPTQASGS